MRIPNLKAIVLVMATLLTPLLAHSATVFINISCAKYVEATAANPSDEYNWFVLGFLSGANVVRDRETPVDAASYRVWLTEYCKKYPFDALITGLHQLDKALGSGKAKVTEPARK